METKIRGTQTNIFKVYSSGEGIMYETTSQGNKSYLYDVESVGTPVFSIPFIPTIVFGSSSKTPQDISGYSINVSLDMIVGAQLSVGIDNDFFNFYKDGFLNFTGNNAGSGSFGPNIGLSVSLSNTTIIGPLGPDDKQFSYSTDTAGNPIGTFYGFGVDDGSLVNSANGQFGGSGSNPFDFSNATYVDAGEFSGVPGIGLSYPNFAYNGAFDTGPYDFSNNFAQSASQLAGIGLSLTSDLGGGGYVSYADYGFTPGQTSNSVFDYYGGVGYSPSFDYSSNDYYDYSAFDSSNYDFSASDQNYGGYDPFQSYGQTDFGSYDFSFDFPIVLDLAGTGIKIDPLSSSNTYYDMAGEGYKHRTAWAGAGNGVLVLDLAGTGQITERNQVIFTDWDPTATSDMQAP